MKILLVEDESIMLKTVELKLQREGFEVICCDNGKDALEILDKLEPDLVITDLMLPYSSGIEIIVKVKQKKIQAKIIVLTSLGQEHHVEEAFNLGADDYVTKPFNLNELVFRMNRLLKFK